MMRNDLPDHERALWILKTKGAQPVRNIAQEMDITTEGARFHLLKLEKKELVQAQTKAEGRGRPKKIWSLTDKGNARFPDTHSLLTVQLIQNVEEELGEDSLDKLIDAHEQNILQRYSKEIDESDPLEGKIQKLCDIRSREGYMAEYKREDDAWLLIENHCPICMAAETCQGFCRSELNIFQEVLGDDIEVERVEHIIKGARRCCYRITEK